MKRNVFVVFGLGALFSAGIFAPGCSSSSSSPSKDSGYDTAREDSAGGTGGAAIDGPAGHGGSLDVATGAGGSAELDAAPDTAKSDAAPDLVVQHDVADAQPDVPLNYPDGSRSRSDRGPAWHGHGHGHGAAPAARCGPAGWRPGHARRGIRRGA